MLVPSGSVQYLKGIENLKDSHCIKWRGVPESKNPGNLPQSWHLSRLTVRTLTALLAVLAFNLI
jgi:hypothetical protein